MATARVQRGRATEELVARFLREHGFPHAERRPASLPGTDITGTPGWAWECKARRSLDLTGWLKQAASREGMPLLVVRPDGYGESRIADWPVVLRFSDAATLVSHFDNTCEPGDEW